MTKPLISIIVPTLNCEKEINHFFDSLKQQSYPPNKIEIIISDGGSTDRTVRIAHKYKVRVVHNPFIVPDRGVYKGMQEARGELFMVLAIDNIFKDNNAIETIVKTFEDKNIFAAFPKHDSLSQDSLFTKYFNIFTDPFCHFIYGDAANSRTFKNIYQTKVHNRIYDIYDFQSRDCKPMLSLAQGFTLRRIFNKLRHDDFDDIKPVLDLIAEGKKIAYIHSVSLYHHTSRGISHFIRRTRLATQNAVCRKNYGIIHRLDAFTSWQKIKFFIYPIYALSFIFPCIISIYGFFRDKEKMWLFHPIITFISAWVIILQIFITRLNILISHTK